MGTLRRRKICRRQMCKYWSNTVCHLCKHYHFQEVHHQAPLLKTITIYSYCLTNIWSSPSRDIYHDNFPWPVVPAIREGRIMRRIQIGDFFIFLPSACCFVDQMPSLSWSVMMPACSKLLLRRCFSLGVNGQFTLLSYCHVRLLALHSYCAEQVFTVLDSPCHQNFQTEIELDKVNSAIILIWIWLENS